MNFRDILLALLVTATWGFNFVVIKWGVAEVPPLFLTGLRFVAAVFPAIFLVRRPVSSMPRLALYGFVMGSCQFGFLFVAMKLGFAASLSSVVMQMQAFFTMALAVILLGDRPRPVQILGALVAFAGVALIAASHWSPQELLPFALVLAAALSWGIANIMAKKSGEKDMLSFVVWSCIFAPLPLFALSWLYEDHAVIIESVMHPSVTVIGSVLYLAWMATLVGLGIWNSLLTRYSTATVAPFSLLVPVFGISSGVLVLGDSFSGLVVWGAVLVFMGLLLNVLGPRWLSPAAM